MLTVGFITNISNEGQANHHQTQTASKLIEPTEALWVILTTTALEGNEVPEFLESDVSFSNLLGNIWKENCTGT